MSLNAQEVGRRLAKAREAKLWTQLEFAAAANVSPSTIQRWEAGKLPPVRELIRVAGLLDIDAEQLVEAPAEEDRPQAVLLREVSVSVEEGLRLLRGLPERLDRLEAEVGRLAGDGRARRTGTRR